MSVEIPAEFTPFVESLIASGQFNTESAVVAQALRIMKALQAADENLRRDVLQGFAQLEQGESFPGEEVLDRLQSRAERLAHGNRQ
jgi:putative addiction module CopG family antidote